MIPRVSRGRNFKGAMLYYTHDKGSETKERVGWTRTVNLPNDDAEKAFSYMAYTAMHAEELKQQAGVVSTGRKATAGAVYTVSLAWHPEQDPSRTHMERAAFSMLEVLGLADHEAVMINHTDTDHAHVHVVANLVNPEDGRMADVANDYLTLSRWAEQYEKEHEKIYCPQRVENNRLRDTQHRMVKYKQQRLDRAEQIGQLYNQSDSGQAFKAALEANGYSLARGDRRGVVLVDESGKIHSLSRQLKGQRAKDIRERLGAELIAGLSPAEALVQKRQQAQTADPQQQQAPPQPDQQSQKSEPKPAEPSPPKEENNRSAERNQAYLDQLDKQRQQDQQADRLRELLKQKQKGFYQREKRLRELQQLKKQIETARPKERKQLKKQYLDLKAGLDNMDSRIQEQRDALEKRIQNGQHAGNQNESSEIEQIKKRWANRRDQGLDNSLKP